MKTKSKALQTSLTKMAKNMPMPKKPSKPGVKRPSQPKMSQPVGRMYK